MASRRSQVARLQTNSLVASIFARVSLIGRSGFRPLGEKATVGGSSDMALKKLKGARLTRPSASRLVTQPMGRGTTRFLKGSTAISWGPFFGS